MKPIAQLPLLLAPLLLTTATPAFASTFSPEEITQAVTEYYDLSEGVELTEADLKELANAISDEIAILRPVHYNSVLAFLLRDYRQKPETRAAIESLISELYVKVLPQLDEDKTHPVITVIDDVFAVWTVAYFVGMGKGLWAARGSGLRGIERFRHILGRISDALPSFRRTALLSAGIGTPIGVVHAVYNHLSTKKLDPRNALHRLQSEILTDLAHRAVRLRDLLRDSSSLPEDNRDDALEKASLEASQARTELAHLYMAAPFLRPKMEPISMDLEEIEERLYELGAPFPDYSLN